jgi:hypothetical protein
MGTVGRVLGVDDVFPLLHTIVDFFNQAKHFAGERDKSDKSEIKIRQDYSREARTWGLSAKSSKSLMHRCEVCV